MVASIFISYRSSERVRRTQRLLVVGGAATKFREKGIDGVKGERDESNFHDKVNIISFYLLFIILIIFGIKYNFISIIF
jgi:hypothetical protein